MDLITVLFLTFVFDAKPANRDISRLIEEEFYLQNHNIKRIGCSEKFAVKILICSATPKNFMKKRMCMRKNFVIFNTNAKTNILFLF